MQCFEKIPCLSQNLLKTQVCTRSIHKDASETPKKNMGNFLRYSALFSRRVIKTLCDISTVYSLLTVLVLSRTLCESLEEPPLVFLVSSHKLFAELLSEEQRKVLVEQMRRKSATVNLSAKPLPSFYDIPGTTDFRVLKSLLHKGTVYNTLPKAKKNTLPT